MIGNERDKVVTRWKRADLLDAYATAWTIVIGGNAPRAALAVLWGQACLETSRDGAHCFNFNVGNVRASDAQPHFLLPGAYEFAAIGRVPAGAIIISPPRGAAVPADRPVCYLLPSNAQRFRAYDNFVEGCTDKVALLHRRWPKAIDALRAAEGASAARAFVLGLVVPPPYFTGDVPSYSSSVLSLAAECLRAPEDDWPTRHDTDPAPAPSSGPPTIPASPTSKSSQRLQAVREPIGVFDGPTGIVVPEGEHDIDTEDIT